MHIGETMAEAEALAERLGTEIPPSIYFTLWALPILEKIEAKLASLDGALERHVGGDLNYP